MKTLAVCSGGLDSTVLAYKIARERELGALLTFDYGQRHKKEIGYAAALANDLGVPHHILDISNIGKMLSGSALTDDIDVPHGHYAEENMKATIVPNRNAIMLTIAYGIASAKDMQSVAAAVHAGDHFIYPDCRPEFIDSFAVMQNCALEGVSDIALYTPFVEISKAAIVEEGARLSVPFEKSWSCYEGGEHHCGRCGTCVERREAFEIAGVDDPTTYADPDYWRRAVQDAKIAGAKR